MSAAVVWLLSVFAGVCYWRRPAPGGPGRSAAAVAEGVAAAAPARDTRPKVIKESDDPIEVVTNAEKAILSVAQRFRCQFVDSHSGAGSSPSTVLEVASRERFRYVATERGRNNSPKKTETIV